jgi:hypothetical protein
MARQEYDLELRRYNGQGWRATFFLRVLSTRSLRMPEARAEPLGGSAARGRGRTEQARSTGAGIDGLDYD